MDLVYHMMPPCVVAAANQFVWFPMSVFSPSGILNPSSSKPRNEDPGAVSKSHKFTECLTGAVVMPPFLWRASSKPLTHNLPPPLASPSGRNHQAYHHRMRKETLCSKSGS